MRHLVSMPSKSATVVPGLIWQSEASRSFQDHLLSRVNFHNGSDVGVPTVVAPLGFFLKPLAAIDFNAFHFPFPYGIPGVIVPAVSESYPTARET